MLLLWLALFKAETKEELERIAELEVPIMEKAINAYHKITVSPEFRELERLRSRARHDQASALYHARNEGIKEGKAEGKIEGKVEEKEEVARNALEMNLSVDDIIKLTGLDAKKIKELSVSSGST